MPARLFIGNLPFDVTERDLREHFSVVGQVIFVSIPKDRETSKPRGFAFIEFNNQAEATEAIRRFNNQPFKGRTISISEAKERESGGRPAVGSHSYTPRPARTPEHSLPTSPPSNEKPGRNFGPDAPPRRARKQPQHGGKSRGGPKQPLREKTGGRFFGGDDEPYNDDFSQVDDDLFRPTKQDEE